MIDGYHTLFAEAAAQAGFDALLVPAGVGSFAAAAARYGALAGKAVIAVEPATAACLTASLAAGEPTAVPTPGTSMAGMDCAEVSPAAWPSLRDGILGTVVRRPTPSRRRRCASWPRSGTRSATAAPRRWPRCAR